MGRPIMNSGGRPSAVGSGPWVATLERPLAERRMATSAGAAVMLMQGSDVGEPWRTVPNAGDWLMFAAEVVIMLPFVHVGSWASGIVRGPRASLLVPPMEVRRGILCKV
jgi:hypothetical protein